MWHRDQSYRRLNFTFNGVNVILSIVGIALLPTYL